MPDGQNSDRWGGNEMGRKRLSGNQYAEIQERNAGVCCVCKRRGIGINVHHIDNDPANNAISNLAVLCVQEHDAHHRPDRYPALNHLDLGADAIREYKEKWEAFVEEARQPHPRVLAAVNVYGTHNHLHSARLLFQWLDGTVILERTYHLLEGPLSQWSDWILDEVKWLGDGIRLAVVDEPLPVEHCSCCGRGLCNVLNSNVVQRLTVPDWGEKSSCSIYINPDQPSLAIHVAYGDEGLLTASLHKCGNYLHLAAEGLDERFPILPRPSIRTQATSVVEGFLRAWEPAKVFIGTGDHAKPKLIDDLSLPPCWER
jgi:hypothetical protein